MGPDLTLDEFKTVLHELKTGKRKLESVLEFIREVFKHAGESFVHSLVDMANDINKISKRNVRWICTVPFETSEVRFLLVILG